MTAPQRNKPNQAKLGLMQQLAEFRYLITPFLAPLSPAIASSVLLYADLAESGWGWELGLFTSCVLGVTLELCGGFAAKAITDFWALRDWARMIIAIVALVGYTVTVAGFVWDTPLFFISLLTPIIYLVAAAQDTRAQTAAQSQTTKETELAIIKEQAKIARAEARKAKLSGFRSENGPKQAETDEGIRKYLDTLELPGKATLKEIMTETGAKQTFAHTHKARYMAEMSKNGESADNGI